MKKANIGIVILCTLLIWSCSQEAFEERDASPRVVMGTTMLDEAPAEPESLSATAPESYISSSAAVENPNDTTRRMIRTADIKFKVKDVIKTTYNIENIVVKNNGFVENTNLASVINRTYETLVKEDSALLTTYYSVVNTLTLRVPNTELDTTLKEIAQFVDFMDYRIISAKDVTLDLLSKRLEQNRLARYDDRMTDAIDSKGKRLNDVGSAEESLLRKQEQSDMAKLTNLQILDKINYSTITLFLYQNQSIKHEMIVKEKKIKPYSPPFGTRFIEALKSGWDIVLVTCLLLANIWPVILISFFVFLGIRYYKKKVSKPNS